MRTANGSSGGRPFLAEAQSRATEAFRADVLAQRATAWRSWHEQAAYVEELADRLPTLGVPGQTGLDGGL